MTIHKQYLTRVQRIDMLLAENARLLAENTELRQHPNIPECPLCQSEHWPHCDAPQTTSADELTDIGLSYRAVDATLRALPLHMPQSAINRLGNANHALAVENASLRETVAALHEQLAAIKAAVPPQYVDAALLRF